MNRTWYCFRKRTRFVVSSFAAWEERTHFCHVLNEWAQDLVKWWNRGCVNPASWLVLSLGVGYLGSDQITEPKVHPLAQLCAICQSASSPRIKETLSCVSIMRLRLGTTKCECSRSVPRASTNHQLIFKDKLINPASNVCIHSADQMVWYVTFLQVKFYAYM